MSFLSLFQQTFERQLKEMQPKPNCDSSDVISETYHRSLGRYTEILLGIVTGDQAATMLASHRESTVDFESKCWIRWGRAFDIFELLLVMVTEVGEEHDKQLRPAASESKDWKFEALSHLHARALLVANEIYCLARGGYPDGALTRWRTLYELLITALFVRDNDSQIALRYLALPRFQALKTAKDMNAQRGDREEPVFAPDEIEAIEESCSEFAELIGERLDTKDYCWAKPALGGASLTFRSIEAAVNFDSHREDYKWASRHTHSGHYDPATLLGMIESSQFALLVGPSDSGLSAPLSKTAITLLQMSSVFLSIRPNLDRTVLLNVLTALVKKLEAEFSSVRMD